MVQSQIHQLCLLLIGTLIYQPLTASGLFEWLRRAEAPPPPPPPAVEPPPPLPADLLPAPLAKDARFEMATADEKFLAEAKHFEISPLESCHCRVRIAALPFRQRPGFWLKLSGWSFSSGQMQSYSSD